MKENNDIFKKLGVNTASFNDEIERHQETSKSYVRLLLLVQEQIEKLTNQKNLLERMVRMSSEIVELMSGNTSGAAPSARKPTGKKLRKDGKPWAPNPHNIRLQNEVDKKNLSLFVTKAGTPRGVRRADLGEILSSVNNWRYLRARAGLNYITSTKIGKHKVYEITQQGLNRLKEVSCA